MQHSGGGGDGVGGGDTAAGSAARRGRVAFWPNGLAYGTDQQAIFVRRPSPPFAASVPVRTHVVIALQKGASQIAMHVARGERAGAAGEHVEPAVLAVNSWPLPALATCAMTTWASCA